MGKPNAKPNQMTMTRDGNTFTANWKVPGTALDTVKNKNKCFSGISVQCYLNLANTAKTVDAKTLDIETSPSSTSYSFTPALFKKTTMGQIYPSGSKRVQSTSAKARGYHDNVDGKGKFKSRSVGKWSGTATFKVYPPQAPSVTFEYDESKAEVTVKVSSKSDKTEHNPWTWTTVKITGKGPNGKATAVGTSGGKAVYTYTTNTQLEEFTYVVDLSAALTNLQNGKNASVTCEATAKGMGGDSSKISRTYTVSMPPVATISSVTKNGQRIKVALKSAIGGGDLVSAQLQRRHDSTGSWEDVAGGLDDGGCVALYDSVGNALPVPGEYIYYRVKTTRQGYENYSSEFKAAALYTAKQKPKCSATCAIVSVKSASDGESATVVMAYSDSTTNLGSELSWSDRSNAWNSTEAPTTSDFTGNDGTKNAAAKKYKASKTVSLTGITPGEKCYIRMRRYREVDGERYYSGYSSMWTLTPESAEDDTCAIVSVTKSEDGTQATVVIGISEDNANTGTQVQWSDYQYAWYSNQQPSDLMADWAVDSPKKSDAWGKTQTVYLSELNAGATYYVRARRYLESSSNTTYGPWSNVASFTTQRGKYSTDVRCGILSVTAGDDGASATVVLGWDGDHTGCEVSWAKEQDAWNSTEEPSAYEFEESDPSSESDAWSHTSTIVVRGLEDGVQYYFRGRSYYDVEGKDRQWSDYTTDMTATSYSTPEEVVLTAPESIARGENIEAYWTLSGELEQKDWRIHEANSPGSSLASGTGSITHGTITPDRYGDADSIEFYVEAGYGGALTQSNTVAVGIGDMPACETCISDTVTAQPASFEAYTDNSAASLLMTVFSSGITYAGPGGDRDQVEGDVIWTSPAAVEWTAATWGDTALRARLSDAVAAAQDAYDAAAATAELEPTEDNVIARDNAQAALNSATASLAAHPADGDVFMASVSLPPGLDLVDGGRYTLSTKAVEPVHGLTSEAHEAAFTIEWAHQAPMPNTDITVEVDGENRTAKINLIPPQDAVEGDVYDVYRKKPTGYEPILRDAPLTCEVTDRYAPFGADAELDYRVCCRTADGDEEYCDFEYELPVRLLRFDWDDGSVELPWNIETDDSFSKSFELREHLDGSMQGYFEKGIRREGSYSSDINKVEGLEQVNLVKRLGEHAGAVFCRTRHGDAFQCNVDVDSVSAKYAQHAVPVRLRITAMDLTDDFRILDSDVEVPPNA